MKTIASIAIYLTAACGFALAQSSTQVNIDSGSFQVMNQGSSFLTAGPAGDGNGAVLQLGYYSGATSGSSNFVGTWTPLTGQGSANTDIILGSTAQYNQSSIGDKNTDTGNTDGTFSIQFFFGSNAANSMNLPPAGTILSIRFYNNTTLASSSFYNAVSNDTWVWANPAFPPSTVVMSLDNAGLEWQSIAMGQAATTAFHTSIAIPIPEPSTMVLLGMALSALPVIYRRKRKA